MFECLDELNGKLHTAIQTSGYCEAELFDKALEKADYFLFDLKLIDDDMHKKYTGVSNRKIIRNFSALAKSEKAFVVRVPLIPSVTDTVENITGIIKTLKDNGVNYVELLPYNKMAGGKYRMLGRQYSPLFDEQQPVNINEDLFSRNNIHFKVL